jgi:hypothetical protein
MLREFLSCSCEKQQGGAEQLQEGTGIGGSVGHICEALKITAKTV